MHNTVKYISLSGAPPSVTEEQLDKSTRAASKATRSLKDRHSSGFGSRSLGKIMVDPGEEEDDSKEDCGEFELWRLLPQLKKVPEAFLKRSSS